MSPASSLLGRQVRRTRPERRVAPRVAVQNPSAADLPLDIEVGEVDEVLQRGRALSARGIQVLPELPELPQDMGARWECQACDLTSAVCGTEAEAVHLAEEHDHLHHGVRPRRSGLTFLAHWIRGAA